MMNPDMGSTQEFISVKVLGLLTAISAHRMSIIQAIKHLAPNSETAITRPWLLLAIEMQC